MQSKMVWSQWAQTLQRHQLDGLVAWLLESGAPLTLLGAQLMHLAQPFISGTHTQLIASMLEDEEQTAGFLQALRGDAQ